MGAMGSGCAIFASEWGTCDASGDGSLDLGETQAWLNFFKEHHISDANWAVSDKTEACSALRPGAGGNGGWLVPPVELQLRSMGWVLRRWCSGTGMQMNSLSQTNHRVAFLPHADELVESDKPSDGILATCYSFRSLPLCGCFCMQFIVEELVELGKPSGGILATCFSF